MTTDLSDDMPTQATAVADAWGIYQRLCMTPDASAHDSVARRRAFYAGAVTMLTILQSVQEAANDDDALRRHLMCSLATELAVFQTTTGLWDDGAQGQPDYHIIPT